MSYVVLMLHGAAAVIWKSLQMNGIMLHMSHDCTAIARLKQKTS